MNTRVVIIVFDALRPAFVTPELMPRLSAFAAEGVLCTDHHAAFPTETRVNQSAVITGCYPHRHGIVANRFSLPSDPSAIVSTGDDFALEAMLAGMGEPLLQVPSAGDLLAAAGLRYASVSAGTSGGGRLINLDARMHGHPRYTLRRTEATVPDTLADQIAARIGPVPELAYPAVAWNRHAVDAWLEVIEPAHAPDLSLIWLCEPDESFHWHGIGSEQSLDAIRGVDAAFGALLDARAEQIATGALQVIAMSDHGQITLTGGKLDLATRLAAAGFSVSGTPGDGGDLSVAVHNAGGIWVRGHDPAGIAAVVAWLQEQDWCGAVFTRDGLDGTLPHAEIMADHPRAPDIYLTLATTDGPNAWDHAGLSRDNAPYPDGGGCHGGLSRYELHNVLTLGGTAFRRSHRSDIATGNIDILPTVLHLLGVALPHPIDGRVLTEALPGGAIPAVMRETRDSGRTGLAFSRVGTTRYLDRAWVERS